MYIFSSLTLSGITVSMLPLEFKLINPFKQNGISHYYQLDRSVSVLRVEQYYFTFYSNFNAIFCKQTVKTEIKRNIQWCLICVCAVGHVPQKGR